MAKDPAFLFYSKDWLEGTGEMEPAEKGIFIDLLAHQHQKNSLPKDTEKLARLARVSHDEFLKYWPSLQQKFIATGDRLVNQKMLTVIIERTSKAHKNRIAGIFATLCRQSKLPAEKIGGIKNLFKVDDFLEVSNELLTERLTEWFIQRSKSIANADEDSFLKEEGGGEENFMEIYQSMMRSFKILFPKYFFDKENDYLAIQEIANKVIRWDVVAGSASDQQLHILKRWGELCAHIKSDSHFSKYSLSQISKHFQSIIQSFNYGNQSRTSRQNHSHQPVITGTATTAGSFGDN
jgi:uncharacterized protein YdaU (DUF1376 family)